MEQVNQSGATITLIHLVYERLAAPADNLPEGPPVPQWRIACMPNMTEFHETPYHRNYQRTDEPRAVTCPACRATEAYRSRMVANG